MADQTQYGSRARRAPPPADAGKIERWHQTLKNRILLENYYLPGDLEAKIDAFVDHYNHRRYHESLSNLIPADVYFVSGVRQPQTKQGHGARSPDKRLLTDV